MENNKRKCTDGSNGDQDSKKRIKTSAPPLVLLDADTGQQVLVTDAAELRRYELAKLGDENTPAVIAAAKRALLAMQSGDLVVDEQSLAFIAATIYKHCLRYDYYGGVWRFAKGKSVLCFGFGAIFRAAFSTVRRCFVVLEVCCGHFYLGSLRLKRRCGART
jgi:hypothetical protein